MPQFTNVQHLHNVMSMNNKAYLSGRYSTGDRLRHFACLCAIEQAAWSGNFSSTVALF